MGVKSVLLKAFCGILITLGLASCNDDKHRNEGGEWFQSKHFIAHSGGGYNMMTYTDSLEAWKNSYSRGTRVFDADLNFTADGVLVLRHEWGDDLGQEGVGSGIVPDYETFMNTPIFPNRDGGHLTPMDAKMMLEFMAEHGDVYVACDTKTDTYRTYSALFECARSLGLEDVLERIIVSFYWKEDKAAALRAWNFRHFALRYYFNNFNNFNNFNEVRDMCRELDVPVCMVWSSFIRDDGEWRVLLESGISVWTAVIDDREEWNRLRALGVSGCVTNFLFEDEL